ncbi:MAG: penicillin-binding protein [Mycobacteriales bacterium]
MNRPLRRVSIAALILFGLLVANANYVQVFEGDNLRTDPGNTRVLLDEYERQRGAIVVDGKSIAESRPTNDKLRYLRVYPGQATYAPATGFYSLIYGGTGIEQTDNDLLTGSDNRLFTRRLSDLLTGRDPRGGNVVLTLNRAAQEAAYKALAGRRGAVAALDPRTGAILALVSSPSYDPTVLSSHDPTAIRDSYDKLTSDADAPMLDRAINQSYPPGSTFKVVVSAAALQNGRNPDTVVDCPHRLKLPQSSKELKNFGDETCGADRVPLITAFTNSYNTAFAKLGLDLGASAIRRQAQAFGINDSGFSMPLDVSGSSVGPIVDDASLAQSSIGQRDVKLTPLEGAMIAAAVANRGQLMKPYLVKELQAPDLSVLDATKAEPLNPDQPQAIPPEVAGQLTTMMTSVVNNGTGRRAKIPGVQVAGKTGTAENAPGKQPHAWFIGFAPADNPTVAVAVVIENAGNENSEATGGEASAPIAADVIKAILGSQRGGG